MFNYAEQHYYIEKNPCNFVDSRCKLLRCHHHQALSERQMSACEDDYWRWMAKEHPERVKKKQQDDASLHRVSGQLLDSYGQPLAGVSHQYMPEVLHRWGILH